MSYSCYIIDDESEMAKQIISYVERHEELYLLGYEQDSYIAAQKLLSGEIKPDLCFLEVQLGSITGLEIARIIHKLTTIIFISGSKEYAVDAYETDAVDYLLKPVQYMRFVEAVEKAKRLWMAKRESSDRAYFFVKDVFSGKLLRVLNADLLAIEGNGNFVFLHIAGQHKPVMTNLSMTAASAKPSDQCLLKSHKRFIVNLAHITAINGNEIEVGDMTIPLSRRCRSDFLKAIGARKTQ